ncbi:hypothetical protein QJS04_geneDACA002741 [Acorus gramineus]|uniref:Uncharacterized protein n=1 Tax=Acorus gramineus TaxID=55184 RepID=A0AAV9BU67_ACOGR|nr:hypothetical protein QJS04_geneDACA002741 [Acorus gramineus]
MSRVEPADNGSPPTPLCQYVYHFETKIDLYLLYFAIHVSSLRELARPMPTN